MADEEARIDFDHHSPEFASDPLGTYAKLRSRCPVAHTDRHGGYWVVTKYDDVAKVSRDDDTFASDHDPEGIRNGYEGINIPPAAGRPIPIEMDPPEVFDFRKLLNPYFSPTATERARPRILEFTNRCIDDTIESGQIDLVMDLASPVPSMITVEILGLPIESWKPIAEASHASIYTPPTSPDFSKVRANQQQMQRDLMSTIHARRKQPQNDLISELVNAEVAGRRLDDEEVLSIVGLIIAGGVDTTTALVANAFIYLDENHAARRMLAEDPGKLPSACEEFLRFFTPVQALARTATRDVELGDQQVRAGDRVLMCWGSANHDAAAFESPEEIQLDRFPNRHTAFGLGIHRCLGSNLARAQFCIMIEQVLARLPDYRVLKQQARRYETIGIVNGWVKVPATFTPGRRIGA